MGFLKENRYGILQWDWIFDLRFAIEVPIVIGIRFIIKPLFVGGFLFC